MTTHPKMTRDEERKLLALAKAGDRDATERMIAQWLPFVQRYVNRWSGLVPRGELDDLFAVGMIAVWRAIVDFDLDATNQFGAFVGRYITGDVRQEAKKLLYRLSKFLTGNTLFREPMSRDKGPVDRLMAKEIAEEVNMAISSKLRGQQLRILRACAIDGRTSDDIGWELGVGTTYINNVVREARQKLSGSSRLKSLAS